jgi:hypothetical protein
VNRIKNSFDLVRSSWNVLSADRDLIWLPIIALAATIVVGATFVIPVAAIDHSTGHFGPIDVMLAAVGYFVLAFITVFSNAALVFAADERMRGGDPSLASALRGAWSRRGKIAQWSAVSATVSVVLRMIESRGGIVGRIVGTIAGIAWSLVTFLVLPVLVVENVGVRDALRRSSQLFKKTWGEQVIANAGIGIVGFVGILIGLPVLMLASAAGGVVMVAGIVLFALWVLAVMAVTTALSAVFQTALYHYAANGMPPAAFAQADLERAFRPRQSSRQTWA